MMCEIVIHGDAGRNAGNFEPAPHAAERLQRLDCLAWSDPGHRGSRDGRQRIAAVVLARQGQPEAAMDECTVAHVELVGAGFLDVADMPAGRIIEPFHIAPAAALQYAL